MNKTSIVSILDNNIIIGNTITISGWVRTKRVSKAGFSFISIYDGSCFNSLQIIANNKLKNYTNEILLLTTGCSVIITGIIQKSKGQKQSIELLATKINIIGMIENPNTYPITTKKHSLEYLRKVAHLRPRTNLIGAIMRIRNTLAQSIHRFFSKEGYIWISTPIITTLDAEGAGKMFQVSTLNFNNIPFDKKKIDFNKDFFGCATFLTVSGQLHNEAYVTALSKVYTFGPTFRAENSNTNRHLAEFWMVEPEVAFANLNDIILLAEKMLKYLITKVLQQRNDDLIFFSNFLDKQIIDRLNKFIESTFVQINYTEAINILQEKNQKFKNKIFWGMDFSSEHEHYLTNFVFKSPVIILNYPKNIKAFYMRLNDDNKTVAAMDMLLPGIGEIIGGSQREERLNKLDLRMQEMGIQQKNYTWYRDLRRYGTVPHAGFGLGFERLVAYVTNTKNIRDIIPFPRTPNNTSF